MIKKLNDINLLITKYLGKKHLVDIFLFEIKDVNGYLDKEILEYVANRAKYRLSELYEIAEFYDLFGLKEENNINKVEISFSPDCYVKGAGKILIYLKYLLKTLKRETTIKLNYKCNCLKGISVKINERMFHNIQISNMKKIISDIKRERI